MDERAPRRGPGRPATGQTPKRNVRVGDIWDQAAAIAERRGETMTEIVVPAIERELRRYVERYSDQVDGG